MSIPLKRRTLTTPSPFNPTHHAPDVFLSFQFPLLKKTDNAQLCTGKIEAIPSNNIENRRSQIKISVHYTLSPAVN